MLNYIVRSPRGFANETDIFSYDPKNETEATVAEEILNPSSGWAHRITRKEAESICAKNRKEGGTAQNPVGAKGITRISDWLRWREQNEI
jgi:hypothetical protein